MDKGLTSSMWHPRNSGQPSYHFNKKSTTTTSTTTSTSTSTGLATMASTSTRTGAVAAPPSKSSKTKGKPTNPAADHSTTPTPSCSIYSPSGSPYQLDLNSALRRVPTPWAELARYTKIVRRLKWKLPFLAHGYNAATGQVCGTDEQREEAELMFKLDFFEYYMLLERAMVHLLGVFGIKVTAGFGARLGNGRAGHKRGDSEPREQSDHRFHANVLESFYDPLNPLHEILGKDDVCLALLRAKELRNRWKNADDPEAVLAAKLPNTSKATRPLKEYDLERILGTIFAGFDQSFQIAEQYVNEVRTLAVARGLAGGADASNGQTEEWEFITDAMDWEAV